MATITVSSSGNMHDLSTWYGDIASYDSNHITIVNGPLVGTYTGNFSYDALGNVYGVWTGFSEAFQGVPNLSIAGLSMSANYAEQFIESNQIQSLLQIALAGNDQFTLAPGIHVIDGYGGYNTVTEPFSYASYSVVNQGSSLTLTSSVSQDVLYNIQAVNFSDGTYTVASHTFASSVSPSTPTSSQTSISILDTTTRQPIASNSQPYTGPVAGLSQQYINISSDSLNVNATSPGWFIHTGSGTDAIAVASGINVLDGGTGSNFLTGGSGTDTFFVDDRNAPADIWSTVNNFHSGDAATIWGVTPQDFVIGWQDNQGASGYTGLTLHATSSGRPTASLTLTGYDTADLTNGRLSLTYGTDAASGSSYLYVRGN